MPPVHYESESSAGSDDENTDVSSILKQSTDGDVPAQTDRMLTTIQRLAAQIHNNKQSAIDTSSLPEAHPKTIVADMPPVKIKTEKISPDKSDPESSNIIMSPTKIKTEVKNEPLSPSEVSSYFLMKTFFKLSQIYIYFINLKPRIINKSTIFSDEE